MRLYLRVLALALAAVSSVTCTEASPIDPTAALAGHVAIAPSFSTEAAAAFRSLAAFGLDVTNVHVRLTGPDGAVTETTVQFGASDTLRIEMPVPASRVDQLFSALIELRNANNVVLFSGTQQLIARGLGAPAGTTPAVSLQYTGPGRDTRTISISPRDSAVTGVTTLAVAAVGIDAAGKVVPDLLVRWTSSDTTLATVTASGDAAASVHTLGKRGVVSLTALTPVGVAGTARLTVGPAASRIVLVSGAGQTGPAGRALAQPIVVEMQATDNLAVAGAPVSFRAVTAGGSVSVSSAVTDASGRASTVLTVGRTAGSYSFDVTSGAITPLVVTETATPAEASVLTIVSGNAQTDSTGATLSAPLVVKASDEFGGAVAGATIDWTARSSSGVIGTPTSTTGSDGLAKTTYALGSAAGTDTVRVQIRGSPSGPSSTVLFTETALARAPQRLIVVSGSGQTGVPGATLANPLLVRAVNAQGIGVVGVTVTFSGTGMSFAPKLAVTGAGGIAQTTITLASASGTFSGTASAGPTLSVQFSETSKNPANSFQVLQSLQDTIGLQQYVYRPLKVRLLDPFGVALKTYGVTITATGIVTPPDGGTHVYQSQTDTGGVATLYLDPYVGPLGIMTITLTAPGTTPLVLPPITIVEDYQDPYAVGSRSPLPSGSGAPSSIRSRSAKRAAETRPESRTGRPH